MHIEGRTPPSASPSIHLRQGALAVAPLLIGVPPFGVIAGVAAIEAGLGLAEAVGFSVLVFAGAAQLAAIDLLGSGAMVWVAVLTALVINLRMAMYSASLAAHLSAEPRPRRALAAYLLTDQAFALSVARFAERDSLDQRSGSAASGTDGGRWWFYLGAAVPLWVTWQATTVAGVVVGDAVPEAVPLGFAVPMVFISLVVPSITDRPTLAAGLSAAVVAVVGAPLPAKLGMPLAALTGVAVGWALARHHASKRAGHQADGGAAGGGP